MTVSSWEKLILVVRTCLVGEESRARDRRTVESQKETALWVSAFWASRSLEKAWIFSENLGGAHFFDDLDFTSLSSVLDFYPTELHKGGLFKHGFYGNVLTAAMGNEHKKGGICVQK